MAFVGTCGFPRARAEVFSKIHAVEIQETFYRHVGAATVKKWRHGAPKDFVFSVKASQHITHEPTSPTYRRSDLKIDEDAARRYGSFRMTREVLAAWRRTEEACKILEARAVLFQTPSSFRPEEENIQNLNEFLRRTDTTMTRAWEPRGGWPPDIIGEICSKHNVVHCVDPFAQETVTGKVAYFRLHGKPPGTRNYYYSYSEAELRKLKEICSGFEEAFIFFNNISMLADAQRFRGILDIQG